MLSFFIAIAGIINKVKDNINKKTEKYKTQRNTLREEMGLDSEEEGSNEKSKVGTVLIGLSAVIAFFEILPFFMSIILWGLLLLILAILIVVIYAFLTSLTAYLNLEVFENPKTEPTGQMCEQIGGGKLAWSEAELSARGAKLSDHEKNIYRLGIIANRTIGGFGGGELMPVKGLSKQDKVIFAMGIASTETGMRFYTGGKNSDILKVPSNIALNGSGYGVMGINGKKNLASYYNTKVVSAIKSSYSPEGNMPYVASYLPYAVAMSVKHQHNDMKAYTTTDKAVPLLNKTAKEWGFGAKSSKEFITFSQVFIAQAHYHGAVVKDYPALMNFFAAFLHATSDNDDERSYSKWSIKQGSTYDESSVRNSFVGSGGKSSLAGKGSPSQVKGTGSTKILLNGKELSEPVWNYLGTKYADNSGFAVAWKNVKMYSGYSGGLGDRVLNFHYGINSYLQAKRAENELSAKMGIVGESQVQTVCKDGSTAEAVDVKVGDFKETPGKGQSIIAGKPFDAWLDGKVKSGNGGAIWANNYLKKDMGTSSVLNGKNSKVKALNYTDKRFGVPFYGQGGSYVESYGEKRYSPSGPTFNWAGCAVYSHAYATSALTGRLVNPAEMGALLTIYGNMTSGGALNKGAFKSMYSDLGLKSAYYDSGRSVLVPSSQGKGVGKDIPSTLKAGGVAVVRFATGEFAKGIPNHFLVLTGVETKNGKDYYSMYTSVNISQSNQVYTREHLLNRGMHSTAVLVWK